MNTSLHQTIVQANIIEVNTSDSLVLYAMDKSLKTDVITEEFLKTKLQKGIIRHLFDRPLIIDCGISTTMYITTVCV